MSVVVSREVALEDVKEWLARFGVAVTCTEKKRSLAERCLSEIAEAVSEGRITINGDTLTYRASHPMLQAMQFGAPTGAVLLAASRYDNHVEQSLGATVAWCGALREHVEALPVHEFEEVLTLWALFRYSRRKR